MQEFSCKQTTIYKVKDIYECIDVFNKKYLHSTLYAIIMFYVILTFRTMYSLNFDMCPDRILNLYPRYSTNVNSVKKVRNTSTQKYRTLLLHLVSW